ncbi:hypothetical protein NXX09_00755 [Bacteroides uniformis]|nr:hypothetical protein [Bacteroides uniformis]
MQEDPDDVRNQAYTVVPKTKRAYIAKYQPQSGKAVEDSNIPSTSSVRTLSDCCRSGCKAQ